MNEIQKFNLHRHLIIQALKALMEYLIRMSKDERSVSKDYYFEHFEKIYEYMLKADYDRSALMFEDSDIDSINTNAGQYDAEIIFKRQEHSA